MAVRYLVMPRGINVGTYNRVPMAELRSKLADEGYSDVVTVLTEDCHFCRGTRCWHG